MDINVDSKVLKELANGLKGCRKKMTEASSSMRSFNRSMSSQLEGNQYNLSEEATNASCAKIDASCDDLGALTVFLENLAKHVEEYNTCKYTGGKK